MSETRRMILLSHMHLRMAYRLSGEAPPRSILRGPNGLPCPAVMDRLAGARRTLTQAEYDELYDRLGYGDAGDLEMIKREYQDSVSAAWVAGLIFHGLKSKVPHGPTKLGGPLVLPTLEELAQNDDAREQRQAQAREYCERLFAPDPDES
jgi:hypothetical protein